MRKRAFDVGRWVEVRSREEILTTLDGNGRLGGMPFMPEMFQHCGKRFRVYKRAHKTCDYTTPHPFRTRRLEGAVHLETRCDGAAHGGCQAGCLIYWKESWLKPVDQTRKDDFAAKGETVSAAGALDLRAGGYEENVWGHTSVSNDDGTLQYVCQATEVPEATSPLAWWDVRQYIQDYWSGNVGLGRLVSALIYSVYYSVSQSGIGFGRSMRWLYNAFCWVWRGPRWPRTPGVLPEGAQTPRTKLNLQSGEWVRVKSHEEILQTVTTANLNRGMHWDAELVPYCGGIFQVLKRVDRIIDEKTGQMLEMKTPGIILDSVVCQARYSECRKLCPKSIYPFWREVWLERVDGHA